MPNPGDSEKGASAKPAGTVGPARAAREEPARPKATNCRCGAEPIDRGRCRNADGRHGRPPGAGREIGEHVDLAEQSLFTRRGQCRAFARTSLFVVGRLGLERREDPVVQRTIHDVDRQPRDAFGRRAKVLESIADFVLERKN